MSNGVARPGTALLLVIVTMTVLLVMSKVVWDSIAMLYESTMARQRCLYERLAMDDLLYYGSALGKQHIARAKAGTYTYALSPWPPDDGMWRAQLTLVVEERTVHISALLLNQDTCVLRGQCSLELSGTDTVLHEPRWYIATWAIAP